MNHEEEVDDHVVSDGNINKHGVYSHITIKALSSRNNVYMIINDVLVYRKERGADDFRGIHIVVINQYEGHVMASSSFDTFAGDNGHLVDFLTSIQNGRIVVFMIGDEGSWKLASDTKNVIEIYGSRYVCKLGYRHTWVFISKSGLYSYDEKTDENGGPTTIKFKIDLEVDRDKCKWGNGTEWEKRKAFCSKYEGFGDLCNCSKPLSLTDIKAPSLKDNRIYNIPIAILAENRPRHLFKMLKRLLETTGINRDMITVFVNGLHTAPAELSSLFNLKHLKNTRMCSGPCGISQHHKQTISYVFKKFEKAEYVLLLEDDIEVSFDIMDYFSQLLPVLESDDSVFCISAWNDHGFEHSSNDSAMLYRVETIPSFGFGTLLKRNLFTQELEPHWPRVGSLVNWHSWMHSNEIRNGRVCIVPDVPRTFHFTLNQHIHEFFFKKRALSKKLGVKLKIDSIYRMNYEDKMHNAIKSAEILDHTKSPCDDNFIPNTSNHTYVLYIKYSNSRDYKTWLNVAQCFKIWWLDVRGHREYVFRIWMKQNRLIVIGSMSPYFIHKPNNVTALSMPRERKTSDREKR